MIWEVCIGEACASRFIWDWADEADEADFLACRPFFDYPVILQNLLKEEKSQNLADRPKNPPYPLHPPNPKKTGGGSLSHLAGGSLSHLAGTLLHQRNIPRF